MSFDLQKTNWKIFILGLILGMVILAVFNYYYIKERSIPNSQSNIQGERVTQPVNFDVSPYSHILGNYDAPVTLVVFNDFTCPYCQQYAATLEELIKQRSDQVRVVWKHFPLNQQYLLADIASECADEQGKFWEYAARLYHHSEEFTHDFYIQSAQALNLDKVKFEQCLSSDKYDAKIKADYYEGLMKGVIGAPATFINGNYQPGALPLAQLLKAVDQLKIVK